MLSDGELPLSLEVGQELIASVVLALSVLGSHCGTLSGCRVKTRPVAVLGMTVTAGASHPANGRELSWQVRPRECQKAHIPDSRCLLITVCDPRNDSGANSQKGAPGICGTLEVLGS